MSFTIRLLIWFKGRLVGNDSYGNRYYEEKHRQASHVGHRRRWVIYKGNHEATKIPPEWHAWLHYRADKPVQGKVYSWQKAYKPNLTGTTQAYKPQTTENGKVIRFSTKMKRPYEPWKPNE